jgi:microcystin-dependent protein
MAVDATGTPTSPDSIPTYATSADAPSGKGFNAAMAAIQTALSARVLKNIVTTAGDLLYATGASTLTRLGVGSNGQILTVVSGAPAWAASAGIPAGVIQMYAGTAAPSGYVLCDGASYLRSGGGFDALFAAIGTNYGSADGTHFYVPDLQGRVPVGKGTNASVNALNANDGQAVGNRRPHHRTSISDPQHSHVQTVDANSGGTSSLDNIARTSENGTVTSRATTNPASTGITVGSGVANDALDTPSFIVVNYIIKT